VKKAMKSRIPTSEMMQATGLSRARLSELVAGGVLPKVERGFFPYPEAVSAYCAHIREGAAGRGDTDLSKARARLAMLQGDGHELKNKIARGEYIAADVVRDEWDAAAGLLRAGMMAIPSAIPLTLPHLTRFDLEAIDRAIRDALTVVADQLDAGEHTRERRAK
jgi:phage terminase Nu1 subunit (DNA packaging protein)